MHVKNLCMGCMEDKGDSEVCPQCGWKEGTLPESLAQLPPRTVLNNQYLLGRVLGQGGFGITYLGWDMNLERKVAIKEYFPHGLAGRSQDRTSVSIYSDKAKENFDYGLSKFMEEGKTLAKFQEHPGIVSVLNFFKTNNTGYLVMEYVEGITLKEYLEQEGGKIPFETALNILMPVMDALREVHEGGLLHRDISPENIYITEKGRIKLLDFGAARYAMGEHSKSLSIILKAGYAPEEQYRSKGKQGPWTDVYAVAATFYRAITGEIPPEALDRLEEDTLMAPSKAGVKIPGQPESALMKALSIRAPNRFQAMKEFQEALNKKPEKTHHARETQQALPNTPKQVDTDRRNGIQQQDSKKEDIPGVNAKKKFLNAKNIMIFGICLFFISFFLRVYEIFETVYRGYDAAWFVFQHLFAANLIFAIYLNLANFAMLVIIINQFFKPKKWLAIIPILGFASASYWAFRSESWEIGYWVWFISQTIVYISFEIKLFSEIKSEKFYLKMGSGVVSAKENLDGLRKRR